MIIATLGLWSCHKDLDRAPTNDVPAEVVFSTLDGYQSYAAKVYGSMALTGSFGPGSTDLRGIDAGTSDFLRLWWKAQTLSTDEAVVAWNDPGIQDFHNLNWGSTNPMLTGLYNRCVYSVSVASDFIRESTPEKLQSRGLSSADITEINRYKAEMRFVRAFNYWVLMDLFANPPFVTELDTIGLKPPKQITRTELFKYVEKELLDIEKEGVMGNPKFQYGRADRAAVWAMLSRLYLNAHIYNGGAPRYTDCMTYSKKLIDAGGYSLATNYKDLFLADNHRMTGEIIFPIQYDGLRTQNYGGTTFIVHAQIVGGMTPGDFGVGGGWFGIRSTQNLPNLFPDNTGTIDKRMIFFTGNPKDVVAVSNAGQGWPSTKFKNVTSTGQKGSDPQGEFVDTDFPLFRYAEVLLNYAEAQVRSGGGNGGLGLTYANLVRRRAYGNNSGDFSSLDLEELLKERSRELHWESLRRTDLIRYGHFTSSSFLWPWKGGVLSGTGAGAFRNVYPIPAADLGANPNLTQNSNY